MTTHVGEDHAHCPIDRLLKALSGKWKPQIFRLATQGPLRFNTLLRQLPEANKQSMTVALRELEALKLLERKIIREKPLHVEYYLTPHGQSLIPIFLSLEQFNS